MRRALGSILVLLALQSCAGTYVDEEVAATDSYYGFSGSVSNAPPPPDVRWVRRPDLDRIPGTNVYYVDETGYDVFFFRNRYWLTNGGYWYMSDGHRGPFISVDVRTVPRQVLRVPDRHWRHWRRDPEWSDRGRYRR